MDYTFIGYSTNSQKIAKRKWVLTDIELIKQDLLNHFHTKKGERVMRPDFGSSFWEYIMEPNTDTVRSLIEEEVRRVVSLDIRLRLEKIDLYVKNHTVIVNVTLFLRPFNTVETLELSFDKRNT